VDDDTVGPNTEDAQGHMSEAHPMHGLLHISGPDVQVVCLTSLSAALLCKATTARGSLKLFKRCSAQQNSDA